MAADAPSGAAAASGEPEEPYSANERYERTYSRSLSLALSSGLEALKVAPSTTNDYAIACALADVQDARPSAPPARPDTSMDEALALELQQRETGQLLRAPSRKAFRRDRALRALLHHLKPTRVIPRLNPRLEPTPSYVSEDRQRLLLRLDMYGLAERQVQGDGNCQFRAMADQLYYSQNRHAEVRRVVVDQLCSCPERYRDYVTTDYKEYVSSMSQSGTWGDHITLQAAADAFHVGVNVITSFLDSCVISITPVPTEQQQQQPEGVQQQARQLKEEQAASAQAQGQQAQAMQALQQAAHQELPQPTSPLTEEGITLWLSFWAEVHYNSIAPKASNASSSEDSSSEEEDGGKFMGSARLGRLVRHVLEG